MNPWLLLAIAVLWGLSIAGSATKWASLKVAEVRSEYLVRDNKALAEANAKITALNDAARATEARRVAEMSILATNYSKGFRDAEAQRQRDVAAARDGSLVLRIPASACGPAGGEAAALGPAAARNNAAAATILPPEITGRLFDLANEADEIVMQLTACQAVIAADRDDAPKGGG